MTTIDTISGRALDEAFKEFTRVHDHAGSVCPSCKSLGLAMATSHESRLFESIMNHALKQTTSEAEMEQLLRMTLKAGLTIGMIAAEQARSKEVM